MNTKTFTAVLEILLYFQAESPVAREQALHLGDIAKSRRARGTREETRKWGEAGRGFPLRPRRSLARSRAARPNRRACSLAKCPVAGRVWQ